MPKLEWDKFACTADYIIAVTDRIEELEKKLAVFTNPDNWEFEQTDDEFGEWIWRGYHDPIGTEKDDDGA